MANGDVPNGDGDLAVSAHDGSALLDPGCFSAARLEVSARLADAEAAHELEHNKKTWSNFRRRNPATSSHQSHRAFVETQHVPVTASAHRIRTVDRSCSTRSWPHAGLSSLVETRTRRRGDQAVTRLTDPTRQGQRSAGAPPDVAASADEVDRSHASTQADAPELVYPLHPSSEAVSKIQT